MPDTVVVLGRIVIPAQPGIHDFSTARDPGYRLSPV
jgi:hypothetical protein